MVDKTSPLTSVGDQLHIHEGGNMGKEQGLCNESSMDPCTDLLDTLFTRLYSYTSRNVGQMPGPVEQVLRLLYLQERRRNID